MSKYDQLNYLTLSETRHEIPECIKNKENEEVVIPEELIGIEINKIKNCLNIQTEEDDKNFEFANKNQYKMTLDYFKNGNFFSDNMDKDEKREFLLDYLEFHFGSDVDGKYFELYLQDIFNLRQYELIDEDFDVMIYDYFKKHTINLNDPEDRKKFKNIMFHENIQFLDRETAQKLIEERKKPLEDNNINDINNIKESNESNDEDNES